MSVVVKLSKEIISIPSSVYERRVPEKQKQNWNKNLFAQQNYFEVEYASMRKFG